MKYLSGLLFLTLCFQSCGTKSDYNSTPFNRVINGKKEGRFIYYDTDSSINSILNYSQDSLNGECLWYHNNGKIRSKVNYVSNLEDGMAYYFFKSGVIESFREWKSGNKVGYANDYYDTTGELKAAMLYNTKGELVLRKTFSPGGKLINEERSQGF